MLNFIRRLIQCLSTEKPPKSLCDEICAWSLDRGPLLTIASNAELQTANTYFLHLDVLISYRRAAAPMRMAANPPLDFPPRALAALVGAASADAELDAPEDDVAELVLVDMLEVADRVLELVADVAPELVAEDLLEDVAEAVESEAEDIDATVFLDSTTN